MEGFWLPDWLAPRYDTCLTVVLRNYLVKEDGTFASFKGASRIKKTVTVFGRVIAALSLTVLAGAALVNLLLRTIVVTSVYEKGVIDHCSNLIAALALPIILLVAAPFGYLPQYSCSKMNGIVKRTDFGSMCSWEAERALKDGINPNEILTGLVTSKEKINQNTVGVLHTLLRNGADKDLMIENEPVLIHYVKKVETNMVVVLIAHKADLNKSSTAGMTPIQQCVTTWNDLLNSQKTNICQFIFERLLYQGANIEGLEKFMTESKLSEDLKTKVLEIVKGKQQPQATNRTELLWHRLGQLQEMR